MILFIGLLIPLNMIIRVDIHSLEILFLKIYLIKIFKTVKKILHSRTSPWSMQT
jgi:hypothetical protein